MLKLLKNHKGSTLLMVLITTTVLTVLGTAVITMTLMNINMKYNDYRNKKTMYFAESGIDQVYAVVGHYVDLSLENATNMTTTEITSLKDALNATFEDTDLTNDGIVIGDYDHDSIVDDRDQDGLINEVEYFIVDADHELVDRYFNDEILQALADDIFKYYFKVYLDNLSNDDIYNDIIALNDTYIDDTLTAASSHLTISLNKDAISDFTNSIASEHGVALYTIPSVTSTFNLKDMSERTIITDIIIKEPTMQYPLKITENRISIANNPLWHNALVSNSDIIFNNDNVTTIAGDIYSYGSIPSSDTEKRNSDLYGGITATEGSNVEITGDAITHSNFQVKDNASQLSLYDGHVYCSSLVTQTNATGSKILINNANLYTKDDIELNGTNNEIEIQGSYYGFSNGNAEVSHDASSCILINDVDDSGNLEGKLTITGENPSLMFKDLSGAELYDEPDSNHGIYIGGTAYINVDGDDTDPNYLVEAWPYQTGESFAIKNNFRAYIESFSPGTVTVAHAENTLNDLTYYEASNVVFGISEIGLPFAIGHQSIEDLTMIKFNENNKNDYFMNYYSIDKALDTPLINTGDSSTIVINNDNIKYSLGSYIANTGSVTEIMPYEGGIDTFNSVVGDIAKDYLFSIYTSLNRTNIDAAISSDSGYNIVSHFTNMSVPVTYDPSIKPYVPNNSLNATQVIYASDEPTEHVYIVGVGGALGSGANDVNIVIDSSTGSRMQGIIVTAGDITITGDLDFVGTIISSGNIYVSGGTKTFRNGDELTDKAVFYYISQLINSNYQLRDFFDITELGSIDYLESVVVGTENASNIDRRYKDLIDFDYWEVN